MKEKDNINSIYQLYIHDIYRFLLSLCHNHHTSEDLVQETFIRAHLYIEKYKGENVKTWLFTIAHHVFIDYYRKHSRLIVKEDTYFSTLFDGNKGTEEEVIVQEDIREIINLLEYLPEKHKYAVLLHDFHHMTHQEAAQVMNVKPAHFKVLLFRGRQTIRRRREEKDGRL